jgi:hypothetical protein
MALAQAYTSDVKHAGTDAGIDVELVGDRGVTSGKLPLSHQTKDLFERGQVRGCLRCQLLRVNVMLQFFI